MAPEYYRVFESSPSGSQLVNLQNTEGREFRDSSHLILKNLASPIFFWGGGKVDGSSIGHVSNGAENVRLINV